MYLSIVAWLFVTEAHGQPPVGEAIPTAAEPTVPQKAVAAARSRLGIPYRWDGRQTNKLPGLDCLGLLFRSYGDVTGTSWWRYPVNPTPLVGSGLLGAPVPGLDAVLRADLDATQLQPGDVVYFLLANTPIPDDPLWTHDGSPYWPWHTGMYVGDGRVVQAQPGGVVTEGLIEDVRFDALFVTRLPQ